MTVMCLYNVSLRPIADIRTTLSLAYQKQVFTLSLYTRLLKYNFILPIHLIKNNFESL